MSGDALHPHPQPTPKGSQQVGLGTCLWGLVLSAGSRKRWPRTVATRAEYMWSPSRGQSCSAMCACSWLGNARRQERQDRWQAAALSVHRYCPSPSLWGDATPILRWCGFREVNAITPASGEGHMTRSGQSELSVHQPCGIRP